MREEPWSSVGVAIDMAETEKWGINAACDKVESWMVFSVLLECMPMAHGAVIARHADGMWIISLYDNVADEG